MSKRLVGGIIGCKDKTSSWQFNGSPMAVTLGQQNNIGEKPTVILYTYTDHHAGTPNKTGTFKISLDYSSICNIGSRTGIGWVSMKEIYYIVMGIERYILTSSSSYGVL